MTITEKPTELRAEIRHLVPGAILTIHILHRGLKVPNPRTHVVVAYPEGDDRSFRTITLEQAAQFSPEELASGLVTKDSVERMPGYIGIGTVCGRKVESIYCTFEGYV